MQIVGKITGVILALIAIPLFMLAACNASLDATLRAPDTYADVLEDEAIFEELLPVAFPAIVQAAHRHFANAGLIGEVPVEIGDVVRTLDSESWREITNLLVDPAWLQIQTGQIVNALLNIINGNLDAIDEPFDLSAVGQRLAGPQAAQAAELIVTSAPPCTRTQMDIISTVLTTNTGTLPICNPDDASLREGSIGVFTTWFATVAETLQSDTPTLGDFFQMKRDNARAIHLIFETDRQGLFLTYLCPLALLALIVMTALRSIKGFGRWMGIIFIVSGGGVFVVLVGMQVAAFNLIAQVLSAETDIQLFAARVVSEMTRSAFSHASGTMLVFGGIYIAIGFIALVVSWFVSRDNEAGELVLIGEDGQIISTATQKRIGQIDTGEGH